MPPIISSRVFAARWKAKIFQFARAFAQTDWWKPLVPLLGIALVLLVLLSYVLSVRAFLVDRWACDISAFDCRSSLFRAIYVHDFLVAYLGTLTLFHYISTIFRSPGVVLSSHHHRWSSWKGQGGIMGVGAVCSPSAEKRRVALYGKLPQQLEENEDSLFGASYCFVCRHVRPPRCHHCSKCGRCILQYDHHCIWVNQCIGYNNYRNFLLFLSFLAVSCWYGAIVLFPFFWEPLQEQVAHHQGWFQYWQANSYSLLVPMPMQVLRILWGDDTKASRSMMVRLLVPLMCSVGAIITVFGASHWRMAGRGVTTLENRRITVTDGGGNKSNPFDRGSVRSNILQILGRSWWLWFLPLPVDPPRPFLVPQYQ